ncbi:hypothetical protein [Patiriisocius marinus]|uniref:hypothetical protein n=1 Tax=Patiriisocius marinus TaxID=1397112 RepID=UPI00232CAE39|nr:hypothetical protein [Patiriisocius marinus]
MKSKYFKTFILTLLLSTSYFVGSAQIGIATDKPQGMLDVQNSNLAGIVFPKAALTSSIIAFPVLNPQGGNLAEGTVVFNTNNTSTGNNDVYPGIYAWDGAKWTPQYLIEQAETYEQSGLDFRPTFSGGFVDIPGLGSGTQFTANYTGTYRVKANFNFGAGKLLPSSNGDVRMQTQEGYFRFIFDGSANNIYTHAYSLHNNELLAADQFEDSFRHDSTLVLYLDLDAGTTYDFRLQIDVHSSTGFENSGNSGDGRAHVGIGIPCTVEFTYLEEN